MDQHDDSLSLRARLDRDGFVVVPGLVQGAALADLRAAAERTAAAARAGDWPHVRIVGKQFPPWGAWDRATAAAAAAADAQQPGSGHGIWGVQHVMHPALGADADRFVGSYFGAGGALDVAKQLLGEAGGPGATDDDLVLELYNLLVRPDYRDYALRWHRDDVPAEATAEEEEARLGGSGAGRPAWHAQWNLALWDDASLAVVPGSHRRARTAAERAADAFAPVDGSEGGMPGAMVVHLAAGDAVFYDNNILHCGVYRTAVPRATLHGSVGHVRGGRQRARNVLQHGVGAWIADCRLDTLPPPARARAEGMRARLAALGAAHPDVGYSQVD